MILGGIIFIAVFTVTAMALRRLYMSHPYFKDYSRREIRDIEAALRRNMPK